MLSMGVWLDCHKKDEVDRALNKNIEKNIIDVSML
jgi:hypothetical protein